MRSVAVLIIAALTLLAGNAPPAAAEAALAVSAGAKHSCALTTGGSMKCWGLWGGTTPADVPGLSSGVAAIGVGSYHSCAVTTGGGVKCGGDNVDGQLGDGTTTDRWPPVDVAGLGSGIAAVDAAVRHTCALTTGGGLKCWGLNSSGQLGDGTLTNRSTPVDVSGQSSGVAAVTVGDHHTCALTTSGGLKCWGNGNSGQLGNGTTFYRTTPVNVSGLSSGVASVAAGYAHTCAVTTSGAVKCWGNNYSGQLGDGTNTDRLTPVNVPGLSSGVVAVAAGSGHSCAVTVIGGKCWGDNHFGQLGDGNTTSSTTPVDVLGLGSGVALSTEWLHTCAMTMGGGLKCWGYNDYSQLGDGTFGHPSCDCWAAPVEVQGFQPNLDGDGDGVPDISDNCPVLQNPGQADTDSDGDGDACDNCPEVANPDQKNSDVDPQGDACDPDDDNDGTADASDNCPLFPSANQADSDGDLAGDPCDGAGSGNVDCGFSVNSIDALKVLRHSAALSVAQNEPCLDIGLPRLLAPPDDWKMGDVDCSGGVNSIDALKILRAVAGLSVAKPPACPDLKPP